MKIIELKNITKTYRQGGMFRQGKTVHVLSDVNLTIEPGACLGLLGRSGEGKSTLGRLVLGLERPDSGEVLYHGKSVHSLSRADYREYRRNVQVVFQNSFGSVNPRFTAFDIIAEPLKNFESHSSDALREIVKNLLDRVGLTNEDAHKYPHQFSGGELQRICIARAIALNPGLIVLDEAVSSLDMLVQAGIIELLVDLKNTLNTAYLFISHDIRVLMKMSDQLAVLSEGRIVEQADPKKLDLRKSHPVLSSLIKAVLPPSPEMAA